MAEKRYVSLTLMCQNHEAARFVWDRTASRACRGVEVCDARYLPLGTLGWDHKVSRTGITQWMHNRSIPELRPNVHEVTQRVGAADPTDLLTRGLGLSLSDQYWLRPLDSDATWENVNYFHNGYSPELGEAMLPHDSGSYPAGPVFRKDSLGPSGSSLLASSPDVALGGNLPKRWIRTTDGHDWLVKGGTPVNRYQEPFNERIATRLCAKLLERRDFVPYELRNNGYLRWTSACPCMVDSNTEFVPAIDLWRSCRPRNDESLYSFYLRVCAQMDTDVTESVTKMLAVDYLLANYDRHWNNFGLLMNSETREVVGAAPLFDMGECLWCNRLAAEGFNGYSMPAGQPRPFSRDLDDQVFRWSRGQLGWLDLDALQGFGEVIVEVLRQNPIVAAEPHRLDDILAAFEGRVEKLRSLVG